VNSGALQQANKIGDLERRMSNGVEGTRHVLKRSSVIAHLQLVYGGELLLQISNFLEAIRHVAQDRRQAHQLAGFFTPKRYDREFERNVRPVLSLCRERQAHRHDRIGFHQSP
jgi:hypothetical protein